MPGRHLRLSAGAIALAALVLAGCSSPSDTEDRATTSTASAPSEPIAPSAPSAPVVTAPVVADGGQCAVDAPNVKAIVVQGAVDCGTLGAVWAQAVADPLFATHGNRNTIMVEGWTCRAHAVTPIPTGFCEDAGYRNKFKIVRNG